MNKLLIMGILSLMIVGITQYFNSSEVNLQEKFEIYARKYGKFYGPSEKIYRTKIYEQRINLFQSHNSDQTQTYKIGENQFTDITQEEFQQIYLTKRTYQKQEQNEKYQANNKINLTSANWAGLIDIKDQGQCGASWAFAAIGAVESIFRINGVTEEDLSEQQLIDCDLESQGCDDGNVVNALDWIKNNGVTTEINYPYTGKTQVCKRSKGLYKIQQYQKVDPDQMQYALFTSPIAASVDGSSWIFYKSGIFNHCSFNELNHDILIVGFFDDGTWIVQNSWGQWWGENGMIKLPQGNSCGIQEQPFIAQA